MGAVKQSEIEGLSERWNEWTIPEVREAIEDSIDASFSRSFFFHGPPAIGKTAAVRQAASRKGRKLVYDPISQKDPADLRGVLCANPADGKARWLVTPEYDPLFTEACVLFLDEFNHAPDLIQKAAYEIALDHGIGGHRFHPETLVILAGNREVDNANITPLDKPMQTRLVHAYVRFDFPTFLTFARTEGGFHPLVTEYLSTRPDKAFKINCGTQEFYGDPTPRTWEFVSDIMRRFKRNVEKLVAGAVGPGEATEFMAWNRVCGELGPLIESVINGDNAMAAAMDKQYFVSLSVVERFRHDRQMATRVLEYAVAIKDRFPEIGGLMIKAAFMIDGAALKGSSGAFRSAMKSYSKYIAG